MSLIKKIKIITLNLKKHMVTINKIIKIEFNEKR
jgi:hypothetical protein